MGQHCGCAIFLHDTGMPATEFTRLMHAARMRDDTNFVADVFNVVGYTCRFLFMDETALQFFIMGSDAGRAGVLVAL